MKIQHLIEAPIYRWQEEWRGIDLPEIDVPAREQRRSRGSVSGPALEFAYALELNGVECPRRWRSTFCTTNTEKSGFVESPVHYPGIREVIIPDGVPVATAVNDFNFINWGNTVLYSAAETAEIVRSNVPDKELKNAYKKWSLKWNDLVYTPMMSDGQYEGLKQAVAAFDELLMSDEVDPSWVSPTILQHGSLKAAIAYYGTQILNSGKFKMYDSVKDIPEGKNLEVWFEGPYKAVRIDSPEVENQE